VLETDAIRVPSNTRTQMPKRAQRINKTVRMMTSKKDRVNTTELSWLANSSPGSRGLFEKTVKTYGGKAGAERESESRTADIKSKTTQKKR